MFLNCFFQFSVKAKDFSELFVCFFLGRNVIYNGCLFLLFRIRAFNFFKLFSPFYIEIECARRFISQYRQKLDYITSAHTSIGSFHCIGWRIFNFYSPVHGNSNMRVRYYSLEKCSYLKQS